MKKLPLVVTCAIGGLAYRALAKGELTIDTGLGRTVRPLGPMEFEFRAPRDLVFDLLAAPYSTRAPRALRDKVQVIERGQDMVLAAHRTTVRPGLETVTVEVVRFDRPGRMDFRLVKGPVPQVTESFELHEHNDRTTLLYRGEIGADFWALGRWWVDRVAQRWEAAVSSALVAVEEQTARLAR